MSEEVPSSNPSCEATNADSENHAGKSNLEKSSVEMSQSDHEQSLPKNTSNDSQVVIFWNWVYGVKSVEFDESISWALVFCSFLVQVASLGIQYSFGVMFESLQQMFDANAAATAGIGSLSFSLTLGCAAVSGPLADTRGFRQVTLTGVLLVAVGLATSLLATKIWHLYLTWGLILGTGCGFIYLPSIAAVAQLFQKHRALAVGCAVAGSGMGGAIMSPLLQIWLKSGGVKEAIKNLLLIFTPVSLVCVLSLRRRVGRTEFVASKDSKQISTVGIMKKIARKKEFMMLFAAQIFASMGYLTPFTFVARLAGGDNAPAILTIIGASSTLGRILGGRVADRIRSGFKVYFSSLFLCGIGILVLGMLPSRFALKAIAAGWFGLFAGSFIATETVVAADLFGTDVIGTASGMLYFGVAIGLLAGPVIAGAMLDAGMSDSEVFGVSAGMLLLCLPCIAGIPRIVASKTPTDSKSSDEALDSNKPSSVDIEMQEIGKTLPGSPEFVDDHLQNSSK